MKGVSMSGPLPPIDVLAEQIRFLCEDDAAFEALRTAAANTAYRQFRNRIYIRGLIEMTNYCRNDCYYCGIRNSNQKLERYRLTKEAVVSCCIEGYDLGFRTFVLQGGEDGYYRKEDIADIVSEIKRRFPDCAVTLSLGEYDGDAYQMWFDAGADRYLLRHETAGKEHYAKLHPKEMSPEHRKQCLYRLREIGYQVGSGFMVGSPYQTYEDLAEDLHFLKELEPHMIGIGPYVPHKDTPFAGRQAGTLRQTLVMIALLRLLFPQALIPSTTALSTIAPDGREQGFLAGANVVMPNLSPVSVRDKYMLYDNKRNTGEESAQCLESLKRCARKAGYEIVTDRGDYPGFIREGKV